MARNMLSWRKIISRARAREENNLSLHADTRSRSEIQRKQNHSGISLTLLLVIDTRHDFRWSKSLFLWAFPRQLLFHIRVELLRYLSRRFSNFENVNELIPRIDICSLQMATGWRIWEMERICGPDDCEMNGIAYANFFPWTVNMGDA